MQERAGLAGQADRLLGGRRAELSPEEGALPAEQRWIVVGAADAGGRMWASVLFGAPGFLSAPSPGSVHVEARPLPGDPLAATLGAPVDAIGGLVISRAAAVASD